MAPQPIAVPGFEALTRSEARVLKVLLEWAPSWAEHQDLTKAIGDGDNAIVVVRQHIHNLRKKLGKDHIESISGAGYRWVP